MPYPVAGGVVFRPFPTGDAQLYFVVVKYAYECVVMSEREVFTFELDEPLGRGDLFTHAGHVYEVMEDPQLGVTTERGSACA